MISIDCPQISRDCPNAELIFYSASLDFPTHFYRRLWSMIYDLWSISFFSFKTLSNIMVGWDFCDDFHLITDQSYVALSLLLNLLFIKIFIILTVATMSNFSCFVLFSVFKLIIITCCLIGHILITSKHICWCADQTYLFKLNMLVLLPSLMIPPYVLLYEYSSKKLATLYVVGWNWRICIDSIK